MGRVIRRPLLFSLLAVALAGAACTNSSSAPPPSGGEVLPSPSALNATHTPLLPTDRFALPQLDYGQFRTLLDQLRGTPVVVNVWASWCGPCRQEAPHLAAAARRYGNRVQFLGIDIQDQRRPAQQSIRDFGWPYPSVFDPTSQIQHGLGFFAQPVTLFFDRSGHQVTFDDHGRMVSAHSGPITSDLLDRVIRRLLA
jgi:thiol-disulfide isomerase/thioredoxin